MDKNRPVALGASEYNLRHNHVTGVGVSWSIEELDHAIDHHVANVFYDEEGKKEIASLLEDSGDLDFELIEIREALNDDRVPDDWRVGEAIAQTYITHHRKCNFPWSSNRDEKTKGSILPGCDLVGFYSVGDRTIFAFCEVKTSPQEKYPPSVLDSLTTQMLDLQNKNKIRELCLYLGYRAAGASWKEQFKSAYREFQKSYTNIHSFGLLIRDVAATDKDLRRIVERIGSSKPDDILVEFIAIYLPLKTISTLPDKIIKTRSRGNQ